MSDFVKRDDLGFVSQLNNFKTKLPNYQAALGLDPAVITAVENDASFFGFSVTAIDTAKSYSQGWTSLKDNARDGEGSNPINSFPAPVDVTTPPTAVLPGIETRFRKLVRQIKANSAYTEQMGEDLGIVAPEDTTTLTAPKLKIKLDGGNPVISFVKSKSDGIKLYSKRGAETEFTFLAVDTKSPYTDTRPNLTPGEAETRQYYAFFLKDDEQVGTQSDVIEISVT